MNASRPKTVDRYTFESHEKPLFFVCLTFDKSSVCCNFMRIDFTCFCASVLAGQKQRALTLNAPSSGRFRSRLRHLIPAVLSAHSASLSDLDFNSTPGRKIQRVVTDRRTFPLVLGGTMPAAPVGDSVPVTELSKAPPDSVQEEKTPHIEDVAASSPRSTDGQPEDEADAASGESCEIPGLPIEDDEPVSSASALGISPPLLAPSEKAVSTTCVLEDGSRLQHQEPTIHEQPHELEQQQQQQQQQLQQQTQPQPYRPPPPSSPLPQEQQPQQPQGPITVGEDDSRSQRGSTGGSDNDGAGGYGAAQARMPRNFRIALDGYTLQRDEDGIFAAYRINVTAGLHQWHVLRRLGLQCTLSAGTHPVRYCVRVVDMS